MSTLSVSNIKKTGETASRDVSGVAAAWVNFNGTGTVVVRDSVNVSSLTDNGTGSYTVNLTNNFVDADIAVSGSGGQPANNAGYEINFYAANITPTSPNSSQIGTKGLSSTGTAVADLPFVTILAHGDLA